SAAVAVNENPPRNGQHPAECGSGAPIKLPTVLPGAQVGFGSDIFRLGLQAATQRHNVTKDVEMRAGIEAGKGFRLCQGSGTLKKARQKCHWFSPYDEHCIAVPR